MRVAISGAACLFAGALASAPPAAYPRSVDPIGNTTMEYAKRDVPTPEPVSWKGIRYEAAEGKAHGFDHNGGVIAAVEEATGQTLWTLRVYRVDMDPDEEEDVQEVFITRLTLGQGGEQLLVEAENGRRFTISLAERAVRETPRP